MLSLARARRRQKARAKGKSKGLLEAAGISVPDPKVRRLRAREVRQGLASLEH